MTDEKSTKKKKNRKSVKEWGILAGVGWAGGVIRLFGCASIYIPSKWGCGASKGLSGNTHLLQKRRPRRENLIVCIGGKVFCLRRVSVSSRSQMSVYRIGFEVLGSIFSYKL